MNLSLVFFISVLLHLSSVLAHAGGHNDEILPTPDSSCDLRSVCFALDESGSLRGSFGEVQTFTVNVVDELIKNTSTVRYSAYTFDSRARLLQTGTTDADKFKATVLGHTARYGGTNIKNGVQACFDDQKGLKGNRVIVLVTDGRDNSGTRSLIPAIVAAGIKVVTVGIGSGVNTQLLKSLASEPKFYVPAELATLVAKAVFVAESVCEVIDLPTDKCEDAYKMCKFMFKGSPNVVPTFSIRNSKPDTVFTTQVVSKKMPNVGVLNVNGIVPEFLTDEGFKPITMFANSRLTPTHFKPYSMRYRPLASGIGHQTFTGNQRRVSKDKCVRISFTHYQLVSTGQNAQVVGNVNGQSEEDMSCVVFKTAKN